MPLPASDHPFGMPFVELQSVDSTNKYAMTLIRENKAHHGMAVFAHEQITGKGQRGKSWSTGKDMNIAVSILVKPLPLIASQAFQLSACAALAAHELFRKYAEDETKIKWPNDIYWRDRKAGGILIENVISSGNETAGNWQWAIIGIGININQTSFAADLPNPVSLKQITGKSFDTVVLAKELCRVFGEKFNELIKNGFENHFLSYCQNLYKLGESVKLKKNNRVFEAKISGIAKTGELITQHAHEERFSFGEIEWVI